MAEHQDAGGGSTHRRVPSHWRWRPDWTPERTALWWYLTFDEHPLLAATSRGLAEALADETAWDVNPAPWLHLTLRELGFLDEITTQVVDDCLAATHLALQDVGPVLLRTAGTGLLPGAVVRWVEPRSEVEVLRDALAGASPRRTATAGEVAPDLVRPHVSVAYARHDLDASGLLGALPRPVEVSLPVSSVVLAAVTRRHQHYEWQVRERVPVGRSRPARHH